jgi:hypothetical protein
MSRDWGFFFNLFFFVEWRMRWVWWLCVVGMLLTQNVVGQDDEEYEEEYEDEGEYEEEGEWEEEEEEEVIEDDNPVVEEEEEAETEAETEAEAEAEVPAVHVEPRTEANPPTPLPPTENYRLVKITFTLSPPVTSKVKLFSSLNFCSRKLTLQFQG